MKSVLYTSILQTPILLLGSLIILVLGFKELGGWDEMMRICGVSHSERLWQHNDRTYTQ